MFRFQTIHFPPDARLRPISAEAVHVFTDSLVVALRQSPTFFNAAVPVPGGPDMTLMWQRAGNSAGIGIWIWKDVMHAACFLLAGLSDDDDDLVLRQYAPSLNPPADVMASIRKANRPVAATLYGSPQSINDLPVIESASALANAFFGTFGELDQRPPLGERMPPPPEPVFWQLWVAGGKINATTHHDYKYLASVPDLPQTIEAFSDRLRESPESFELILNFRQFPRFQVNWRSLGDSTAMANLVYERNNFSATLLLLSGLDARADGGAIEACAATFASKGGTEWQSTLEEIRGFHRPLLVSFADCGMIEIDVSVNLVEWCLAAAFFRATGVI